LQEGARYLLLIVEKMGSRQKAVAAFFAICYDDTMPDRWTPDEDWISQIRDNGDSDCSISCEDVYVKEMCMAKSPCQSFLVGDPLIERGVITDCQKHFYGSLSANPSS
jgi:hypothetical protein